MALPALLLLTLAAGCSREIGGPDSPQGNGETALLGFAPGALSLDNPPAPARPAARADAGPDIENLEAFPTGTAFRVLVYRSGDDPQTAEPVAQNTYKATDDQGTVKATAVDENGRAVSGDTTFISLRRGTYDFYYFSPALPLDRTAAGSFQHLSNGSDYMATYQSQTIDPTRGGTHQIAEVDFWRMSSMIDIRIKPKEGEIIGTLALDPSEGLQVWGLPTSAYYPLGGYPYSLNIEGNAGMVEFTAADFAYEPDNAPTISSRVNGKAKTILPGAVDELRVSVVLTSDGKTMRLSAKMPYQVFEAGHRYLVDLTVSRIADAPKLDMEVLDWDETDWGDNSLGGAYITSATVTPDPTTFTYSSTVFEVTAKGTWLGALPVRARIDGASTALTSGSIAASGQSAQLLIPANPSFTASRTIIFEYRKSANNWVEIDRGTQAAAKAIDTGGGTLIEPEYNMEVNWNNAINYCSDKGTGWRLPTQNELMYYWGVEPSIAESSKFSAGDYWSATADGSSNAWRVDFSKGYTYSYGKSSRFFTRCVMERDSQSGDNYPYVTTVDDGGIVIVLRDDKGGIDKASLFSERVTETKTGNELSADNRISWKFRIQKSTPGKKKWQEAVDYCNNLEEEGYSDWRLPSQRELMMIWLLGGNDNVTKGDKNDTKVGDSSIPVSTPYIYQLSGFTKFSTESSWTATESKEDNTKVWKLGFVNGYCEPIGKTTSNEVRCVRDEER